MNQSMRLSGMTQLYQQQMYNFFHQGPTLNTNESCSKYAAAVNNNSLSICIDDSNKKK